MLVVQIREENKLVLTGMEEKISTLENDNRAMKAEITTLKKNVENLQDRFDEEDSYIRRESLIFSGNAVTAHHSNEDCVLVVQTLLKDKLGHIVKKEDISVSHRLGRKTATQGPDKRSIIAKFCRRDLKRDLLQTCRNRKPVDFYLSESLTPLRQKLAATLRRIKKLPNSPLSGMTTLEGRIFAWVKKAEGETRDKRLCINTLPALEDFCQGYLKRPATEFLVTNQ